MTLHTPFRILAGALFALLLAGGPARAATAVLQSTKDATLYEDSLGLIANGEGQYIFTGMTVAEQLRRSVVQFDVASVVPADVTITDATLVMTLSRAFNATQYAIGVHRVTTGWSEGSSNPGGEEGGGTSADRGDVTWIHTIFDTDFWTNPGGDYENNASASVNVGAALVAYSWTGGDMVADVQGWLDDPSTNFGWIVIGNEVAPGSAKRFGSRQSPTVNFRPRLVVSFADPASGAAKVPDRASEGVPLRANRLPGGLVQLSWSASCLASDTDYGVLEGTIGSASSEIPLVCTTAGATTLSVAPSNNQSYFLVVPINGPLEGSHGKRSGGVERPLGAGTCRGQLIAACP